jgi:hypothetical protein
MVDLYVGDKKNVRIFLNATNRTLKNDAPIEFIQNRNLAPGVSRRRHKRETAVVASNDGSSRTAIGMCGDRKDEKSSNTRDE